jgi:hypothetical protein
MPMLLQIISYDLSNLSPTLKGHYVCVLADFVYLTANHVIASIVLHCSSFPVVPVVRMV